MARPVSIVLFERLWIAALMLGAVNMAVAWPLTLALYRDSGLFDALRIAPRLGLALIDGISLLLPLAVLMLVSRAGSRIASWVALLLAAWALVVIGRMLGERAAVPGSRGMLAVICILLQVAGAGMLLRPDARVWMKRKRE
jgi:Kef-type K+ transport system membrane component KefB